MNFETQLEREQRQARERRENLVGACVTLLVGALLIGVAILSAGCASGDGAKWYAPATWLSHRPADVADRAAKVEATAERAAVKAAQRATHETAYALAVAPASRPVEVATSANEVARGLLDQVAGPMSVDETARLRQLVADLLSENAEVRAAAEKQRATDAANVAEVSQKLARAQSAVDAAAGKLREAFERENALANELRAQRALMWIAGGIAVLCAAGWVYVRFFLGGLPMAAGKVLRDLRAKRPDIAEVVTPMFDGYLNRHEQAAIARHAQ